jgi:hypothetical protein
MSSTLTEQEVRAFVGSSSDYYLRAWQPALAGQGRASGFNIAAFFLAGLWLGYRKMYKATFIVFGVILAETVLEELLFVGVLKMRESPAGMSALVGLVVAVVTGICGNGWYLSHARRAIAEVRSRGLPEDAHLKAIAEHGGTSLGASLGLFVLFMVAVFGIRFVLAALFGQL